MEPMTQEGKDRQDLCRKLAEIRRQIEQPGGYPFDPNKLGEALRAAIDGEFPDDGQSDIISIRHAFNPDRFLPW